MKENHICRCPVCDGITFRVCSHDKGLSFTCTICLETVGDKDLKADKRVTDYWKNVKLQGMLK